MSEKISLDSSAIKQYAPPNVLFDPSVNNMNTLDNLNDLILYDFTDVLDRMHLPFPLTTRNLHPEVSHKNKIK